MKNAEEVKMPSLYGKQMKNGTWFTVYAHNQREAEEWVTKLAKHAEDFVSGSQVERLIDDNRYKEVSYEVSVKSLEAVTDPSYIPFGQRFFETGENLSPICKPLDITPEDLAKRNGNG